VEGGAAEGGALLDRAGGRGRGRGSGERSGGQGAVGPGVVEAGTAARAIVDGRRGGTPHGQRMSSTSTTA
jgi:hypothetical protein